MGSETKFIAVVLLFCIIIPVGLAQENPNIITVFNNREEVPERASDDIEFNGITIISLYVCRFTPESEDTTSFSLDFGDEYSAAKLDLKDILRNDGVINRYLFSWDKVPGNHSKTLLNNLRYYFKFKWTENATINKSRDNMTIYIFKDNKHRAKIIMDEKNEKATIKVGDKKYHLEVRTENGMLNVYSDYDGVDKDIFPKSFRAKKPFVRYELKPLTVEDWKVNNVTLTGSIRVHATIFEPGYCSICLVFPIITEDLNIYEYLFSWDEVPGNHNETLVKMLRDDLKLKWTENVTINKSRDNMTIYISKDNKHTTEIIMDKNKKKAILNLSDDRKFKLKVKMEDGKLNIYKTKYHDFLIADKPLKIDDIVTIDMFKAYIRLKGKDRTRYQIFNNTYKALKNKHFVENGKNEEPYYHVYRVAYAWNITNFFCWDEVPGNHSETLLKKILCDDLKRKWAENATINKSHDNMTVYITNDNNTAEIIMGTRNEKATIKVDDKRIHVLNVRTENGTLILSTNTSKTARKLVEENPWEVCGICAAGGNWKEASTGDHIFSVVSEVFQKTPDDIQFFYPEGYGYFVYDQNQKALQAYGYNPYFVRRAELIYLQSFMLETYNNEIGEELEELRDVKEDDYQEKIKDIANIKREIFIALDQFYLIEDSIRYGVNIVFMRYGKQTLGLDITYNDLRDKIEDISKISEDMYTVHTQKEMNKLTWLVILLTIIGIPIAFLNLIFVIFQRKKAK